MIEIIPGIGVSEHELSFSFDRSSGPGGQNVNKVSTRVTLHFDVDKSVSLSGQQKNKVRKALASRINQEGVLRIASSKERTQLANRRATVHRFIELMSTSFHTPAVRKKTRIPASKNKKRLEVKRRHATVKSSRSKVTSDE